MNYERYREEEECVGYRPSEVLVEEFESAMASVEVEEMTVRSSSGDWR
jgi:hypothetical protein